MGKQDLVDMTIDPAKISPLTTITNLTPAQATEGRSAGSLGTVPIGVYKGAAAFFDLDKQNNQPLVSAEQLYIMGILSGREEGYDLRTINVPVTAAPAVMLTGNLTVPAGELWLVNAVVMNCPGDAAGGAGFTLNWHCSLWTDRTAVPSAFGQSYHFAAHALANAVDVVNLLTTHVVPGGGAIQQLDEFGPIATAWAITNRVPLLRLPAGTVITYTVLPDTLVPTAIIACTLQLHGSMARILVA